MWSLTYIALLLVIHGGSSYVIVDSQSLEANSAEKVVFSDVGGESTDDGLVGIIETLKKHTKTVGTNVDGDNVAIGDFTADADDDKKLNLMYALTISTDTDVEGSTEGPDDGDEEEEELTLQAMTEPAVENIESEKHQTSQVTPEQGSLFMSRPTGVPVISGFSSYPYPPPLSHGGYGRPVPSVRPPPGYPAFYYQHQHPISPPKFVYYHQGYPMNHFYG